MPTEPPPIRTVFCANDFSETAALALRQAEALAWQHGAKLVIGHMVEPLPADPYPLPMAAPSQEAEIRQAASDRLATIADALSGEAFPVETMLEVGVPGRGLVDMAQRAGADVLVIGTRGLSGLKHLLLGSTAEYVVRRAECPVLTIHPEDRASIADAKVVLVPTDFSDDAAAAVDTFLDLFRASSLPDVELVFADSVPPYLESMTHERLARYHQTDERLEELEERMVPLVDALVARGFRVTTRVLDGQPVEAISAHAAAREADLIVMCTHGRSAIVNALLGRTAQRVVQVAPCPVLTICPERRRKVGA